MVWQGRHPWERIVVAAWFRAVSPPFPCSELFSPFLPPFPLHSSPAVRDAPRGPPGSRLAAPYSGILRTLFSPPGCAMDWKSSG